MAKTSRRTNRKVKTTPRINRTSKAVILTEEKHVGYETTAWDQVSSDQFASCFRETMNHYNYFYDHKTVVGWARAWVKANMSKTAYKQIKAADDNMISRTAGQVAKIVENGAKLDSATDQAFRRLIQQAIDVGSKTTAEKKQQTSIRRKSPGEILKERAEDLIGEIDQMIDQTFANKSWANPEFKIYDYLTKNEIPYLNAKRLADYLQPQLDELVELTMKKTPELVEGYQYLGGIRVWNKIKGFFQAMIDDLEMYMGAKKTTRKPRAKKAKTASSQVAGLKYLKESPQYKIASVDPTTVIGASVVLLYNTNNRQMTLLTSSSRTGFTISRTSIKDVDVEQSARKRVSSPEKFFQQFTKTTKAGLVRGYNKLKTKPIDVKTSVQVNADTIIWKVFR